MKKSFLVITIFALLVLSVFGIENTMEYPFVVTSAGQSDEVMTVTYLCDEIELAYDFTDTLYLEDLKGGVGLKSCKSNYVESKSKEAVGTPYKTLVIAIGASLKGMGASGLSVEDEANRVKQIISYAKENGMKILAMAIGGEIRRGLPGSPNERMIDEVAPYADLIIATSDTNMDKRFNKIAEENGIEFIEAESAFDLLDLMPEVFSN